LLSCIAEIYTMHSAKRAVF